jgi:hypothetical protein
MSELGRTWENLQRLRAQAKKDDQVFIDEIARIKKKISDLEYKLSRKEIERKSLAQDWSIRLGRIRTFEEEEYYSDVMDADDYEQAFCDYKREEWRQYAAEQAATKQPEYLYSGSYYFVPSQNLWYHISFPTNWVETNEPGTGCIECPSCAECGMLNGVCIGYCARCAIVVYKGERGRGFINTGVELSLDDLAVLFPKAADTYIQGVDLSSIAVPNL